MTSDQLAAVGPVTVDGQTASVEVVDAEAALDAVADHIAARVAELLGSGQVSAMLGESAREALENPAIARGYQFVAPMFYPGSHFVEMRGVYRAREIDLEIWADGYRCWRGLLRLTER